jgi:hypothetical protein
MTAMQVRSNKTTLHARVGAYRPAADGIGGDLALEVLENTTKSPDDDFIRPAPGSTLQTYISADPAIAAGSRVAVELKYLGGPRGGRAIVQSIKPIP